MRKPECRYSDFVACAFSRPRHSDDTAELLRCRAGRHSSPCSHQQALRVGALLFVLQACYSTTRKTRLGQPRGGETLGSTSAELFDVLRRSRCPVWPPLSASNISQRVRNASSPVARASLFHARGRANVRALRVARRDPHLHTFREIGTAVWSDLWVTACHASHCCSQVV